jgi:hypothetical protein
LSRRWWPGDPIDPNDITRLQALMNTERCLYEAARQAAQAVWPELEKALRKLSSAVGAALAPEVRAFALAWVEVLRAGHVLRRKLSRFQVPYFNAAIPTLPIMSGGALATEPNSGSAERIRDLVKAGVLKADEVPDLV